MKHTCNIVAGNSNPGVCARNSTLSRSFWSDLAFESRSAELKDNGNCTIHHLGYLHSDGPLALAKVPLLLLLEWHATSQFLCPLCQPTPKTPAFKMSPWRTYTEVYSGIFSTLNDSFSYPPELVVQFAPAAHERNKNSGGFHHLSVHNPPGYFTLLIV